MRVAVVFPAAVHDVDENWQKGHYLKLLRAVQQTGVDITFFTLTRGKKRYVARMNEVKTVFCSPSFVFPRVPGPLSKARFLWLAELKGARPAYKSALSLFREVKKTNPDLIHLRGFSLTNLLLLPLSKACSIPTVIEPIDVLHTLNPIRSAATRACLGWVTKIFAWERGALNSLTQYGIPDEKIAQIPPTWVDEKQFCPRDKKSSRSELGLDQSYRYLLYVGTVYPQGFIIKDPFELLHVLKELNKVEQKHKLIVAGPGNIEEYQSLAKELGVYKDVITPGYVDPQRLNLYYNAADLFLWPCPQDRDGVGGATTEAMACGLPVISYSGKFACEGDCIVKVPLGDRGAMVKKALEILTDEELKNKLKTNCLERAKEFTFSAVAQRIRTEYEKILKR